MHSSRFLSADIRLPVRIQNVFPRRWHDKAWIFILFFKHSTTANNLFAKYLFTSVHIHWSYNLPLLPALCIEMRPLCKCIVDHIRAPSTYQISCYRFPSLLCCETKWCSMDSSIAKCKLVWYCHLRCERRILQNPLYDFFYKKTFNSFPLDKSPSSPQAWFSSPSLSLY